MRKRQRREKSRWWEAVRIAAGPALWLLARILEVVILKLLES
jgi:hypothetical protein